MKKIIKLLGLGFCLSAIIAIVGYAEYKALQGIEYDEEKDEFYFTSEKDDLSSEIIN